MSIFFRGGGDGTLVVRLGEAVRRAGAVAARHRRRCCEAVARRWGGDGEARCWRLATTCCVRCRSRHHRL